MKIYEKGKKLFIKLPVGSFCFFKYIDLIKSYGYNLEVVWEGDLKLNNKLIEIIIQNYVTKFNSTP